MSSTPSGMRTAFSGGRRFGLKCTSTESNGLETGRTTDTLLATTVGRVHFPFIDQHVDPSQRSHSIQEQQRSMVLDKGHRLTVARGQFPLDQLGIGESTPLPRDDHGLGSLPLRHLADAIPKIAIHANDDTVSGVEKIAHTRLHTGCSGSGSGMGSRDSQAGKRGARTRRGDRESEARPDRDVR